MDNLAPSTSHKSFIFFNVHYNNKVKKPFNRPKKRPPHKTGQAVNTCRIDREKIKKYAKYNQKKDDLLKILTQENKSKDDKGAVSHNEVFEHLEKESDLKRELYDSNEGDVSTYGRIKIKDKTEVLDHDMEFLKKYSKIRSLEQDVLGEEDDEDDQNNKFNGTPSDIGESKVQKIEEESSGKDDLQKAKNSPREIAQEILKFLKEGMAGENNKRQKEPHNNAETLDPPMVKRISVRNISTPKKQIPQIRAEQHSCKKIIKPLGAGNANHSISLNSKVMQRRGNTLSPYVVDVKAKNSQVMFERAKPWRKSVGEAIPRQKISRLSHWVQSQNIKTKSAHDIFGREKFKKEYFHNIWVLSSVERFFVAIGEVIVAAITAMAMPFKLCKRALRYIYRLCKSFLWDYVDKRWAERPSLLFYKKPLMQYLFPESFRLKTAGAFSFAVIAAVLIIPIFAGPAVNSSIEEARGKVLGASMRAADQAKAGITALQELDFGLAQTRFSESSYSWQVAQKKAKEINGAIKAVAALLPQGSSAFDLLVLGEKLTYLGEILSYGAEDVYFESAGGLDSNGNLASERISDNGNITEIEDTNRLLNKLRLVRGNIEFALPIIAEISEISARIDVTALPDEYQAEVSAIISQIPEIARLSDEMYELSGHLLYLLGENDFRRYLVVGANSLELRPSFGGFMGNVMFLEISNGKISAIEVLKGGPYELQGALFERVLAPKPLWLVNPRWEFQDCNWLSDGAASAEKCMWFWEKSGKPSVDGLIAVTGPFIQDLLTISGSVAISLKEFDVKKELLPDPVRGQVTDDGELIITRENFIPISQSIVEAWGIQQSETPKAIFSALTPKILEKVVNTPKDNLPALLEVLLNALRKKDVIIYSKKKDVQNFLNQKNFSGNLRKEKRDFLYVNRTNIGGGKSDQVIRQEIAHKARIEEDGSVRDEVKITLEHLGENGFLPGGKDLFSQKMINSLNSENISYLRVYAPQGSSLVDVYGDFHKVSSDEYEIPDGDLKQDRDLLDSHTTLYFEPKTNTEVSLEFDKTVFSNFISLKAGEKKTFTFVYLLPFSLADEYNSYSLLVQKQPGARVDSFTSILALKLDSAPLWHSAKDGDSLTVNSGVGRFSSDLSEDTYYGIVFSNHE